jgi:hypothetical protein
MVQSSVNVLTMITSNQLTGFYKTSYEDHATVVTSNFLRFSSVIMLTWWSCEFLKLELL